MWRLVTCMSQHSEFVLFSLQAVSQNIQQTCKDGRPPTCRCARLNAQDKMDALQCYTSKGGDLCLSSNLMACSHCCFAGLKTEEQHVCTPSSSPSLPFPTSRPPWKAEQQGGRWRWQELFGNGEAHSPSGSPHSVHCDSKQGPERNNRRLITHTRDVSVGAWSTVTNIGVTALCAETMTAVYISERSSLLLIKPCIPIQVCLKKKKKKEKTKPT